jgi:hypothetical protein
VALPGESMAASTWSGGCPANFETSHTSMNLETEQTAKWGLKTTRQGSNGNVHGGNITIILE